MSAVASADRRGSEFLSLGLGDVAAQRHAEAQHCHQSHDAIPFPMSSFLRANVGAARVAAY